MQKTAGSKADWIQKHNSIGEQVADRLAAEMADLPVVGDEIEHPQRNFPAQGGKKRGCDEGHGPALFYFRREIPIARSLR